MPSAQSQSGQRVRYFRAANARIAAAEQLLQGDTEDRAQIAMYLIQVALECALKARLVQAAELAHRNLEDFLGREAYRDYFRSARGHDLNTLASEACLARALSAEGQLDLLQAHSFGELAGPPYPLRYGERDVHEPQAEAVLCFAHRLIRALRILP